MWFVSVLYIVGAIVYGVGFATSLSTGRAVWFDSSLWGLACVFSLGLRWYFKSEWSSLSLLQKLTAAAFAVPIVGPLLLAFVAGLSIVLYPVRLLLFVGARAVGLGSGSPLDESSRRRARSNRRSPSP